MEIRGHFQKSQSNYAMCTSIQKVKDFIFEISRLLFMELPNLKGLVIISFSEFNSHCHARGETNCERCKNRERDEVIAEVLNLLNAGAKAARTDAEVIAWNWSWGGYQEKIVSRLDETISLMGDYERGGKRSFDGIEHIVDEYSLSYVGPSEQFCEILHDAGRGRKKYAKLQLGVTHEIATVPYFPLMQKIVSKIANMKELGLSGMLECWNFGNILSRNIEVANMMAWDSCDTEPEEILKTLAARDFGKEAAQDFVRSWQTFCDASDHYPFSLRLLYIGPMNHGGAYPLIFEKVNLKN
jgi:hypothetical protein